MSKGSRRLAAIMFTDMVGYTALSQRNEPQALKLLEEHRKLVRQFFSKHNGREIKTIGDSFLVEFDSALEAVRCAFEIQQSLHERNRSRPGEKTVELRVGVHLGDVVHAENDVYGDAVNIASRIEPLAEPGGICITTQVHDQIQNKFEFPFSSLGKKELKNVGQPTEVFKALLPWELDGKMNLNGRRVAVLPFTNMSPDPSDAYFADGMTEELISTISKIRELTVISRTSVMKFKGGGASMGEVGRALSVGSVIEGSVRKSGNRARITAQLIDVNTDGHLWSQTYDRELNDIFAVQSDIAQTVAESLKVQLVSNELKQVEKKPTANAQAYTLYLKGRHYWNERSKEAVHRAANFFQEAVKLDPDYALGYAGLADCYLILAQYGFETPIPSFQRCKELATKALVLDEKLAEAHATLGGVLKYFDYDMAGAEREYRRAIELNPSYASAHQWYFLLLTCQERWDEALSEIRKALDLDPFSLIINCNLGEYFQYRRDYKKAIEQFNKVLEMDPGYAQAHRGLYNSYFLSTTYEEALDELKKIEKLRPGAVYQKSRLAALYIRMGKVEEARKLVASLEKRAIKNEYVDPLGLAFLRFDLGDVDRGFEWLEQAYRERDGHLPYIRILRSLDRVRTDPRYTSLLKRINLA